MRKCWKLAFSPLPTMFFYPSGNNFSVAYMLSAIAFNLDQSKLLTSGKGLPRVYIKVYSKQTCLYVFPIEFPNFTVT